MTLLRVEQLRKTFGQKEVVKGISFEIEEGHCVALLGPNGAGKTTTLSMITGLLSKSGGSVTLNGKPHDVRRDIGFLPQFPSFYNWMTAKEYLVLVGQLSDLKKKQAEMKADELLEWVNLKDAGKRRIGGFSGGMKQRLGLAQAFIHRPKLLILDEPVSALDPIGRREVLTMMQKLKEHTTILFSTHVLHDAEEISDDIIIMANGTIAVSGSLQEIKTTYQQPLIRIKGHKMLTDLSNTIAASKNVIETNQIGNSLEIRVNDLERGRRELLNLLIERDIAFDSLEVSTSTLEDLFIKVVGA